MKNLTEHTNLDGEDDKFPKGEVKKETATQQPKSPELTGFKDTGEKAPVNSSEIVLTKEELKNRELEKVEKEYREKQKQGRDEQPPHSAQTTNDGRADSDSGSSKKSTDSASKPLSNKAAGLASLTSELNAIEDETKAQMKTSEVKKL